MKYITTREECENQIGENVCPGCGGKLSPMRTVDNSGRPTYWVGCSHCACFTNGCKTNIHKIARDLVVNRHFTVYHSMDHWSGKDSNYKAYWMDEQTKGTVNIIHDIINSANKLNIKLDEIQ